MRVSALFFVFCLRLVEVNVSMRNAVMAVFVNVNVATLAQRAPERGRAQADNHQGHTKLEPVADSFGNSNLQC